MLSPKDQKAVQAVIAAMPYAVTTDDYVAVMEAISHEVLRRIEAYEIEVHGRSKLTQQW